MMEAIPTQSMCKVPSPKGKPSRSQCFGNQLDHMMLFRSALVASKGKPETASRSEQIAPIDIGSKSSSERHKSTNVACNLIPEKKHTQGDHLFGNIQNKNYKPPQEHAVLSPAKSLELKKDFHNEHQTKLQTQSSLLIEEAMTPEDRSTLYDDMSSPATSSSGYSTSGSRHSLNGISANTDNGNYYHVLDPEAVFYDMDSDTNDDLPQRASSLKTLSKSQDSKVPLCVRSISERCHSSKVNLQQVKQSMNKIIADLGSMGLCNPEFENLTELVNANIEGRHSRKVAIEIPSYSSASLPRKMRKLRKTSSMNGNTNTTRSCPEQLLFGESRPEIDTDITMVDHQTTDLSKILRQDSVPKIIPEYQYPDNVAQSDDDGSCFEPIYETIAGDDGNDFDIVEHSDILRDVPPKLPARTYQSPFASLPRPPTKQQCKPPRRSSQCLAHSKSVEEYGVPPPLPPPLNSRSCPDVWGKRIKMGVAAKKAWDSRYAGRKVQSPSTGISSCRPFKIPSASDWRPEGGVLV